MEDRINNEKGATYGIRQTRRHSGSRHGRGGHVSHRLFQLRFEYGRNGDLGVLLVQG